jgi:hypothetical protein
MTLLTLILALLLGGGIGATSIANLATPWHGGPTPMDVVSPGQGS